MRQRPPFASLSFFLLLSSSCERAAPVVAVDTLPDASLAPVVLAPSVPPRGITRFDCVSAHPEHRTLSLRGFGSPGPAGAALHLKGNDLSCDLALHSDCNGQAEVRISTGLARSEKVITAVSPERAVTVQLRLSSGPWERAIEPSEGTPYGHVLQVSARAQVRCAAPVTDPRPRYFTDSFVIGLSGGERPRTPEPTDELASDAVEEVDQTAPGENAEAQQAADPGPAPKPLPANLKRGAKVEQTPKSGASDTKQSDTNASDTKTSDAKSAEAARARRAARRARKQQPVEESAPAPVGDGSEAVTE